MYEATHLTRSPYEKHRGPHPGIIAIIYVCLFIVSLILFGILSQGSGFPRPFASPEQAQQIFRQFPDAIRFNALFQFGAAIPLGLFTAAVTSRLRFLGVTATGVNIAQFGGIAASLLITFSSLCSWLLSQPGVANDLPVMHALQLFGFATGGVAHITALGLLLAGISVPCLLGGYTPKWVAWLGLILAGIAELSTLSLVIEQAGYLLPVVRFGAYIWMISTGFTLAKNKPESIHSKEK
ncbi:hypothetical protein [Chryseolinea soli]|uniref:DUF4386 domain-containing protein n=1 Tax=Chryseolinea soli TaxID=2321403 RepID=A0A385SR54_9BACT|nr:hypothetical protein [Chryseolinea soli]AYB32070.1 hypothetical protein D4L85_16495 [Chryseolinea soli]